ncbi:AMP-binding protein [Streptomyces sp. NPDC058475]
MNLASHVVDSARIHPDRAALRLGDAAVSYRALDQGSARLAGVLHDRGVKPGDRVAVMLPNVPEFALAYFGVLRAGGIVVPMNPLLKSREVAYYLGDSGARLLFAWHTFADEARTGAQQA